MCNIFVWITSIVLIAVIAYALYMRNARIKRKSARLEKIRQGCEEMAALYRDDPDLRELSAFVGDIPQTYTRAEIYAYDEFAANIEAVLEKLSSGKLDKIGIVYNDSLSAVVLSVRKKGEDHEKL